MEEIKEIFSQYKDKKRESLIPLLQKVQQKFGYISKDSVLAISRYLEIPSSKVYGVATFYNQFKFEKPGKYHIMVCRGTACHVKGSLNCLKAVEDILKIKAGKTTRDGLFSLEIVACIGACGLAPVISVNGEFFGSMTEEKISKLVKDLRKKEKENV